MSSLRLLDFSDRELLAIVNDIADEEGWCTTEELRAVVFPRAKDTKHARRCVAIRMAWMRRFDVVEKRERAAQDEYTSWRLTEAGGAFVAGTLTEQEKDLLDSIDETGLLPLMTRIGARYRSSSPVGARLLRREWQHGSATR